MVLARTARQRSRFGYFIAEEAAVQQKDTFGWVCISTGYWAVAPGASTSSAMKHPDAGLQKRTR
jgi:hypothetical protein